MEIVEIGVSAFIQTRISDLAWFLACNLNVYPSVYVAHYLHKQ